MGGRVFYHCRRGLHVSHLRGNSKAAQCGEISQHVTQAAILTTRRAVHYEQKKPASRQLCAKSNLFSRDRIKTPKKQPKPHSELRSF